MFADKEKNSFDELEMEFIQNRVTGAKRLVQLFFEHENEVTAEVKINSTPQQKTELQNVDTSEGKTGIWVEENITVIKSELVAEEFSTKENVPGIVQKSFSELKSEAKAPGIIVEEEIPEIIIEEKVREEETEIAETEKVTVSEVEIQEQTVEIPKQEVKSRPVAVQQELQMDDEEPVDIHNKRLGDSFSKEKSVAELAASYAAETSKLDVTAIAAEIKAKIDSAVVSGDLAALLAVYDRKRPLLALASSHLRNWKVDVFSAWVTRAIQSTRDDRLRQAIHGVLPELTV